MDDLISRQAVLKAINNMVKECDSVYVTSALRNLEVIVADLPSAQPQCKKGKWKQVHVGGFTPGGNSLSVCSECGWEFGTHMIYPDYNFCPSCGADMRKDGEADDESGM